MDPLKELLAEKKLQIKDLKADLKEAKKLKETQKQVKIENRISETEQFIKRFSPSVMDPRQVGGIVINYKLYEKFIKKLEGFLITEELTEASLQIKYYKNGTQGELVLWDISRFFLTGSEFKEGKLQETAVI